ncbi:hypothetical protein CQS04_05135 [Chryseomicrobium excrementi]|uniref:DUF2691 domain-containing protein n=1 Tax=Chryseomicrobium excrementi TaxID=2041346 RepID=A0A2M9EZB0_9BACL|nr:DUF2691 family protein [Chryseomicrobium excrementi]PJK16545.1 hypothetical protein CQS04_05135 [Chryseomicrobium excrementi]
MKAIKCELPNDYGYFLSPVMDAFNQESWTWAIEVSEVYQMVDGNMKDAFRAPTTLSNQQFIKSLADHPHYLVFAEWKAFPDVESIRPITNFQEFVSSDCQFIILVVDTSFITVIVKDDSLLANIYNTLLKNGASNLKLLAESEIESTYFTVWGDL